MPVDIRLTKDKVEAYLRELVGSFEIDRDGDYTFRVGSARVFIRVRPLRDENTYIRIWSPFLHGVPASPELFRYVATENSWYFGSLSADETDEGVVLSFGHALLGDFLDPEEFNFAVAGVAGTADNIDNELQLKFGGKVFHAD